MIWVFTTMTIVFLGVLLVGERSNETLRNIAKPVASAGFIGVAVAAGAIDTHYGTWILIGLVLGAAGDIFLLGVSRWSFLAGLVSFLLGHIAYVVAFADLGLNTSVTWIAAIAVAVVAMFVFRWLQPHISPELTWPVVAYVVVISAMLVTAFGAAGAGARFIIPVAASAFFVSDLFVARDRFVHPGLANRLWGLPLYYGAQLLIAWSTMR